MPPNPLTTFFFDPWGHHDSSTNSNGSKSRLALIVVTVTVTTPRYKTSTSWWSLLCYQILSIPCFLALPLCYTRCFHALRFASFQSSSPISLSLHVSTWITTSLQHTYFARSFPSPRRTSAIALHAQYLHTTKKSILPRHLGDLPSSLSLCSRSCSFSWSVARRSVLQQPPSAV